MFARFMKKRRYPAPTGPEYVFAKLANDMIKQAEKQGGLKLVPLTEEMRSQLPFLKPPQPQQPQQPHQPKPKQKKEEEVQQEQPSFDLLKHLDSFDLDGVFWAYPSKRALLAAGRGHTDLAMVLAFEQSTLHFGLVDRTGEYEGGSDPPEQCIHVPLEALATVKVASSGGGGLQCDHKYLIRLSFLSNLASGNSHLEQLTLFMDLEMQDMLRDFLVRRQLLCGRPRREGTAGGLIMDLKPCLEALKALKAGQEEQEEEEENSGGHQEIICTADLQPEA